MEGVIKDIFWIIYKAPMVLYALPKRIPAFRSMFSSGGDYTLERGMQHSTVREGGNTTLRCVSPRHFHGCKFRSPSGVVYNIGIGGGSSYDRARIDCLCMVRPFSKYFLQHIYL